ncbi:hypothetical protein I204_01224 [Kwoniella mangroviensis CBS 8886]|nr:hypothetical protein I204_01224 [Kwoniella mangroviensis CBS 8886]
MTTSYLSLPPVSYLNALDGADRSSLGEIVNEIKAVKDNKSLLVVKAKKGKGNLKKDHWTPVVGHEGGDKDDTSFGTPNRKNLSGLTLKIWQIRLTVSVRLETRGALHE